MRASRAACLAAATCCQGAMVIPVIGVGWTVFVFE
jgi:hypothetical protein